jgi:hypothetical protein
VGWRMHAWEVGWRMHAWEVGWRMHAWEVSPSPCACHPPPNATRRLRRAPSPCAAPRGLGVLPAARTPRTAPYRLGVRRGPPVRRRHPAVCAPVEVAVLRRHLCHHGCVTGEVCL